MKKHAQEVEEVEEMNEAAKEARRAYKRQWAKDHPENVRKWQETYWAKKAAQQREGSPGEERGQDMS